jgi:hypothetical protein
MPAFRFGVSFGGTLVADIAFLNVDLDVESKVPLTPLVAAFGDDVVVLHQGESRGLYTLSCEAANSGCGKDAESIIGSLCEVVENLPEDCRQIWDQCCSRVFDIGYDSGDSPRCFRSVIHPQTIQRVASLGAAIMVTIYRRSKNDAG